MSSARKPSTTFMEKLQDPSYQQRYRAGVIWKLLFLIATTFSVLVLTVLLFTIINDAFGYVAVAYENPPETITPGGVPLEELSGEELIAIMEEHLSAGLIRRFNFEKPLEERSDSALREIIMDRIVNSHVVESWSLFDSLFRRDSIEAFAASRDGVSLEFRAWLTPSFLTRPQASVPERAGIRTAILGSLWMIAITVIVAFPLGVGAAIYLEEYAPDTRATRLIQVNIYNLAGVPSIIYGLLGLAVFVRFMEPLTSGALFGIGDPTTANGRTVLAAGLTLALLILPIIIISAQEAIRAVPQSLRFSSYGLGGTKWQTIRHHVLPAAMGRILTGVILAVSRAIGETAPLVVVGASTFVVLDPDSLFAKFTALPIQIYQWTARPQAEFRNVAAAAIIVLLIMLLSMNSVAILLRNKLSRERRIG